MNPKTFSINEIRENAARKHKLIHFSLQPLSSQAQCNYNASTDKLIPEHKHYEEEE